MITFSHQNVKSHVWAGDSAPVTDLPQPQAQFSTYPGGQSGQPSPNPLPEAAASPPLLPPPRAEEQSSLTPPPRQTRDGFLVAKALERLRDDPSVSRGALAEGLGVSPSKLGKAFRAQVGIAFVDYRNQLRLERFMQLVFPGGGNVSSAARSAGFGSYAQFHRVFRALVGKSPKEYLQHKTAHS